MPSCEGCGGRGTDQYPCTCPESLEDDLERISELEAENAALRKKLELAKQLVINVAESVEHTLKELEK